MKQLDRLNSLFHEYSPNDLVSSEKNNEAFASEVFEVTDSSGESYFLKVLREQHPEAIAKEVEMQKRLKATGIGTPEYVEITPANYVGQHNDERFVLSRRIDGTSPKVVTPKLINSLGATLARLHDCFEGVAVPSNGMQWLNPTRVKSDLEPYHGDTRATIDALLDYGLPIFKQNLPTVVTHGDLWLSNVFTENDEVTTVFDLETAEDTVRIIDLARTYTSLRFNSDYSAQEVIDGLVAGYNTKAKLSITPEETTSMSRAIAFVCGACATWHAVHGTRYLEPYIKLGKEALPTN